MEEKAAKKAPVGLLVTANVTEQNLSSPGKIYYNTQKPVDGALQSNLRKVALKTSSLFSITYDNL